MAYSVTGKTVGRWSAERRSAARDVEVWLGRVESFVISVAILAAGAGLFWLAGAVGQWLAGMLPSPL